ncbi:egg cell-secreted protein 1.4-like [Cynara cardunculus var. scolymus]|uniref:egg cell-secreted protein 1.4-like n=1 Tax=Cynara cardunculus var. scolymus TaxID=59895 RepID=UPI000D629DEF|nr:egg cell-secreted protein 1.4-like [Cynara cardunculus var. scolymus]
MANPSLLILLTLVLPTISRPLATTNAPTLAARLNSHDGQDGASTGCWETLFELQSCTGEIILFFLNGETYLGTGCCRAIEKIEKQCWPSLLGSLGFTTEEGDILRGYCDISSDNDDVPTATPPPPSIIPPPPTTTPPPQAANTTTTTTTVASNSTISVKA